jgi:hypothetical protein
MIRKLATKSAYILNYILKFVRVLGMEVLRLSDIYLSNLTTQNK